jgi:chromosome segregation ATPase
MAFTIGNLITLGIVALTLILYRIADKNNRPLEKVKKYAEKCKEEIAAYAEEKSMAVKNFGIDLDVERKSALQLMKNIQQLTEEELAKKSEAITRIEEHIHAFEASLEELTGMTGRVQENLNRIRDESAFVEHTGKKVSEAKEKFEQVEKAIIAAGKSLEETEGRLEKKNTETLEQIAREVLASAKSIVSDFESTAHIIEGKVEEHRNAVVKAEQERETILVRDLDIVKKTLSDALENAGKRADKMEEASLVKLKEQAQERINQMKLLYEEKVKTLQDTLKTDHAAITEKIKTTNERVNSDIQDMSTRQKTFQQEWLKGIADLDITAKKHKEDIMSSIVKQQEEVKETLTRDRDSISSSLLQQQNDWKLNFSEFKKLADKQRKELDASLNSSKQELNQALTDLKTKTAAAIKQQQDDADAAVKQQQKDITASLNDLKDKSNLAIKQQHQELNAAIGSQQQEMNAALAKTASAFKQHQDEVNSSLGDLKQNTTASIKKQHEELTATLDELKQNTNDAVKHHQDEVNSAIRDLREKSAAAVTNQHENINAALKEQMEEWRLLSKETEQNIISANEKRIEEYTKIQNEAINQLNTLGNDAKKLDGELRLSMQEAISRTEKRFSEFEKEAGAHMEDTAAVFENKAKTLQKELEEIDNELNSIKQQAFDNVSEKLKIFEDEFTVDLGKRTTEIGQKIAGWQAGIQEKLDNRSDELRGEWKKEEEKLTAEQKASITSLDEKITSDLERLKEEASAFEKGIREQMINLEETRSAFAEQIKLDLKDIRVSAEDEVKTQVGQYQISMQETLRQKQRELEKQTNEISEQSKEAYAALSESAQNTRKTYDDWFVSYNARIRELDSSFEDLRKSSRDTAAENEERITSIRQSLDDIRRELGVQKKIFDQTDEMKKDMERTIEEVNADINRLEQRKSEISDIEKQFMHIKQLEQDVQRNMTGFLTEKHRIDLMEKDFERFLKTSQAVDEKLVHVTSSDDILQAMQVQIRKLEDAIKDTEEKYQRIERKNEVIEATNEGIDRNFKSMQKTEAAIKNAEKIITTLSSQFDGIRTSIEALAAENAKATDATEKIAKLDETLAEIERRIAEMNKAREWVANTETRLKELDNSAKAYNKIAKTLIDKESEKASRADSKSAPPPQDRDNVLRLKRQGWKTDDIANALHMSIGEVELILEIGSRD